MKRIQFILLLALFLLAAATQKASAQKAAVGGLVNAWTSSNDDRTTFSITPDIGYTLSEHWYAGVGLGYTYIEEDELTTHGFSLAPYMRYFYHTSGKVRLYIDSTVGVAMDKPEHQDTDWGWQAGFKPGIIIGLTDRFSLAASMGFIGYRDSEDVETLGDDGWGLDLSGNSLQLGFYYSF